jgi:hypothetical protein
MLTDHKFKRRDLLKAAAAVSGVAIITNSNAPVGKASTLTTLLARLSPAPEPAFQNAWLDQLKASLQQAKSAPRPPEPAPIVTPETQAGEAPFPRAGSRNAWNAVGERIRMFYGLSTQTGLKTIADEPVAYLKRVDNAGPPARARMSVRAERLDESFRFWQVESLLDQAADLLDRGIRTRSEWNELAAKSFNLGLDLEEYYRIDAIHQEEIAKGIYTLPHKESIAEWNAASEQIYGHEVVSKILNSANDRYTDPARVQNEITWSQAAAWLSAVPTFQKEYNDNNVSGFQPYAPAGFPNGDKQGHMTLIAGEQTKVTQGTGFVSLNSQLEGEKTSSSAVTKRSQGTYERLRWTKADINFKRLRTMVTRQLADLKANAATMPEGVLNYPDRMAPIQARFDQDFGEALARIFVAQKGLRDIYGYEAPLPEIVRAFADQSVTPRSQKYFDDCLLWVRAAISWVIRFSQLDQNYVMAVSVRSLIGEQSWKQVVEAWKDNQEINKDFAPITFGFDVSEALFPQQRHVRLRGVSAFVVGSDMKGVWQLTATPPKTSYCRHLSTGRGREGAKITLNQQRVPPVRLGRVGLRESLQQPDITGVSALHNVSPFGRWSVSVSGRSTGRTSVKEIDDVQLDFHVAMRYEEDVLYAQL